MERAGHVDRLATECVACRAGPALFNCKSLFEAFSERFGTVLQSGNISQSSSAGIDNAC